MDNMPSTEESRSNTTVMLLWILTGVVIVSAAFLIVPHSADPWHSLNAAGLAAGLYLFALTLSVVRKPIRLVTRIVVGFLALLLIGATAFVWLRMQSSVVDQFQSRQKQSVMSVRGAMISEMSATLLKTLEAYYQQGARKKETLGRTFQRLNGGASESTIIIQPPYRGKVVVELLKPDQIVLVGEYTGHQGRNAEFKNVDGSKGMIQERLILTEKGMIHESDN